MPSSVAPDRGAGALRREAKGGGNARIQAETGDIFSPVACKQEDSRELRGDSLHVSDGE